MSSTKLKMEWLNAQDPRTFMDLPEIQSAFVDLNRRIKQTSQEEAATFYEKEAMYLKRVIFKSYDPNKPNNYLGKCTTFSLYSCFMDMATYGDVLSFNPDDKLCYIEKRGHKAGRNEQGDVWEDRARLIISPYGELAIRQEMGQIAYADPAIVVFEGDDFAIGTDDRGNTTIRWSSKIPRSSKKIIGSFVKITRADRSHIMYYMLQEEIDRLAAFSARQNRNSGANALYGNAEAGTGIDQGFLKAKTLKHGLTTFPKVKLRGTNSSIDEMSTTEENGFEQDPGQQPEPLGPAKSIPQQTVGGSWMGQGQPQPQGNREPVYATNGRNWDEPEDNPAGGYTAKPNQDEEEVF